VWAAPYPSRGGLCADVIMLDGDGARQEMQGMLPIVTCAWPHHLMPGP
jgi:hypothetical protein